MTKKIKVLTVLSAAALGIVTVSCGGQGGGNGDSSVEAATVSRIRHTNIPFLLQNKELNLDEYVTIQYSDNTTDHKYTLTCASEYVTITEHVVVASEIGEYTLVVEAGSMKSKLALSVVSEDQLAIMNFLAPLEQTPQNYKLVVAESTKPEDYLWTYFHNENYVAIFNENDPLEVDEKGESTSTLIAKLADNNAYWGSIVDDGNGNPKASFEAGKVSYNNFYITNDLTLDPTDFSYEEIGGEKVLLSSAAFEESLLSFGASQSPDTALKGAKFEGIIDTDNDGTADTLYLDCLVADEDGNAQSYGLLGISNIGTTTLPWMEEAIADQSYVPAAIKGDEVGTVFAALGTGKNYTMTTELFSADRNGKQVNPADAKDSLVLLFDGASYIKATSTFTEDGAIGTLEQKSATFAEDGTVTISESTLEGQFVNGTAAGEIYTTTYDAEAGKMKDATAVETELTDVWQTPAFANNLSALAVTPSAVSATNWVERNEKGTKIALQGKVGDNDGTTADNVLFQQLFNMNGFYKFGTIMTAAHEFSSGDQHAYSVYSNYLGFVVDTASNEVSILALAQMPFSNVSNKYIGCRITVSAVGETTNDFSVFPLPSAGE